MRLLKIGRSEELSLTDNLHDNIPPYAILSHTWGADEDELTFDDLRRGTGKGKAGYAKIEFCSEQVQKDGLEHVWIDTCCINKASSAELSEALNSMFRWYSGAERCYVYLSDVSSRKRDHGGSTEETWKAAFRGSRWFKRGWTLQELLAPGSVEFFSRDGVNLGSKRTLGGLVQGITRIPLSALQGAPLSTFSVDERWRWAAERKTKRVEDQAYCLLGIFGVYMPPIYGEGRNCWARLEDELKRSTRGRPEALGRSRVSTQLEDLALPPADNRKELLASLGFAQMDSRRVTIKRAYSTTCEWFLKHATYTAWLDRDELQRHRGFLWINGKPGAGKSTLMKFIHSSAEKARRNDDVVISFFFNARGDQLEKSTVGMYRSVLFQLFSKVPRLQELLNTLNASFDTNGSNHVWTIEALQDLLSLAVAQLGDRRLTCFIDALDECEEQQIREMIAFWEDLGQNALDEGNEVYICFASRHYPTIDIRNGRQVILESEDGHGEDLTKYVRSHLRAGKSKYVEEVRKQIQEMANGVFMWAVLVVEILNEEIRRGRMWTIKRKLQEIPPQLSDLFKDILRRDHDNMDDMLLCLQWILFAREPLTREQFYFAMVSGLDPEPENLGKWDPNHVTVEDMAQLALNSSKGLAEFTKGKIPTVQFIHESVRDFLLKDNGLCEIWPETASQLHSLSHEKLKQCCSNYLKANAHRCFPPDQEIPGAAGKAGRELRDRLGSEFPFLAYASQRMLYHADEAAERIPQFDFLAKLDRRSLFHVTNMLQRYEIRRHSPHATLMYLFAEKDCPRLIRTAIRNGWSWDFPSTERYGNAFFAALANGHREAVRALLHPNEDSPFEDITIGLPFGRDRSDSRYEPLLLWALANEHRAVAEALVALPRIDLFVKDRAGRNYLSLAAEKGYEHLVSVLLAAGLTNVDSGDLDHRKALSFAAEGGHVAVCEMLLRTKPNLHDCALPGYVSTAATASEQKRAHSQNEIIDACDKFGQSALHCATRGVKTEVVEMLIRLGADVRAKDVEGRTCLHYASKCGNEATVQLLLNQNLGPAHADIQGDTAISHAARAGNLSVLRMLLVGSRDLDIQNKKGYTALMLAIRNRHRAVVQLLLEHGAGLQPRDNEGNTAFLHAFSQPDWGIFSILLERDPIPNDKNIMGDTALIETAGWESCGLDAVLELLKRGVEIDATNDDHETALIWATKCGHDDIVRALVVGRARLDVQDIDGRTALLSACTIPHLSIAKELIAAGADVDIRDTMGLMPVLLALEISEQRQRYDGRLFAYIAPLLLEREAWDNAAGDHGMTALRIALKNRWDDCLGLLRTCGGPIDWTLAVA